MHRDGAQKRVAGLLNTARTYATAARHLREFAKAIGRSMYSISDWENGRAIPRQSSRRQLVDWLGFDPEAIPERG